MCYFSAHLLIQPSLALPALHSLLSWSSACAHCLYFSPVCFCVCCVFSLTGWLNKSSRARQSSPVVHLPHPAGTLVSGMWLSLIRSQEGEVTVVIPEYPLHACSGHFGATQAWVKCWLHCLLGVFPWMSNLTTLKFTFFSTVKCKIPTYIRVLPLKYIISCVAGDYILHYILHWRAVCPAIFPGILNSRTAPTGFYGYLIEEISPAACL